MAKKIAKQKTDLSAVAKKVSAKKTAISNIKKAQSSAVGTAPKKIISHDEIVTKMISVCKDKAEQRDKDDINSLFSQYLIQESEVYECSKKYNVLVLYDDTRIVDSDSDKIYEAIKSFPKNDKPLLLVIYSRGGEPGPAYLIGKLCREFCNNKFVVAVPRRAKSAATLISCAGDEIHMGSLSQLGPIDPQLEGVPVLGLKNSIEHIAELASKYKDAENMFARYLTLAIEPIQIGHYQRIAESAEQYAERLLASHSATLKKTPATIAHDLVHGYKDHGFVIDKFEAVEIFSNDTIKCDTPEYEYANRLYEILSGFEYVAGILKHQLYFIGSLSSGLVLKKKK